MISLLIVTALVLVAVIAIYNQLVRDRNQTAAAWSDIDVQLKRRHTLVPQLVTTVKAYSDHERATMEAVTELRSQSENASDLGQKAVLEEGITSAVQRLIVLAEAYPDLKADQNFRQLQQELTDIEDHLQYARRFYNGSVRVLNTHIQSFPQVLLAGVLGFSSADYFEIVDATERQAPKLGDSL